MMPTFQYYDDGALPPKPWPSAAPSAVSMAACAALFAVLWLLWVAWSRLEAPATDKVFHMVRFNTMQSFLTFAHYSIVLLDAFGLAQQLNNGAGYSGWIIGIYQLWYGIGALLVWVLFQIRPNSCLTFPRALVCSSLGIHILGAAGYVAIAGGYFRHSLNSHVLLAARSLSGLGGGQLMQFNMVSIAKVVPPAERPAPVAKIFFGNTLGVGMGPIMAVLCNLVFGAFRTSSASSGFALVGVAQVAGSLVLLASVATLYPDLSEFVVEEGGEEREGEAAQRGSPGGRKLLESAASAPSPASTTSAASIRSAASERYSEEQADFQGRRWVIAGCIGLTLIRGLGVSSLEAATSYVLETDYRWPAPSIGVVISSTFLAIVPIKLAYSWYQERLSVVGWMRLLMLLCLVGVVLLPLWHHPWWIVALDAVIFPCLYWSDVLGVGVMQRHFLPEGSYFDANHGSLLQSLAANALGRCAGPVVTRPQIESIGFTGYCIQQLVLVLLFFVILEFTVKRNMIID